ncbi:DUF4238 domain-containing protein [Paenibacillus anaericanus]|uniref:DUF4238 domain-containing protein n=1 Tax=Paenibacillus anaericanus TaxID=170367 RepID=A0A3S1DQM1_9BACL|nr:DUF4238 domain-containing protein [Paenibacillus anaericanus]
MNVLERVSNHYVPKFYLRNFSTNKKNIGAFFLEKNLYIPNTSIKSQACQDYLYGEDGSIEEMFSKLEGQAAQIIKQIIETQSVPDRNSEEHHLLLLFMLLSEARNLKSADSISNLIDTQMKVILKMKLEHGQLPDVSHETLEKTSFSHEIPNLLPIQSTIKIYPVLLDLNCCLIINKTDRQFITSDNPLVRYNLMYIRRNYHLRGYGLGNMGIQLFFPISPNLCICIFDHILYDCSVDTNGNIIVNRGKQIDELNKLVYLNSYKTLFFNERTKESYIKKIISNVRHTTTEIKNEITVLGDRDKKLILYSQRKVDQRINLAMFSINKEFVNMPLPLHMGGPMRPHGMEMLENEEK